MASQNATKSSSTLSSAPADSPPNFKIGQKPGQLDVGGLQSEYLEWLPPNPSMHVYILPGNPGCGQYYTNYAASLSKYLGSSAAVTVVSYVGHCEGCTHTDRAFSLEEQIQHKLDFMKQKNGVYDRECSVYVVGHSIGAHIGLQMMRAEPLKVQGVVGLFPFLQVDRKSGKQTRLRMITQSKMCIAIIRAIAPAICSLPQWVLQFLVKLGTDSDMCTHTRHVTLRALLQPSVMHNIAHLASTEFADLDAPMDVDFMERMHRRLAFVYTDDDHWAPFWQFNELMHQIPNMVLEMSQVRVSHAFCTNPEQSEAVAQQTAAILRKLIDHHEGRSPL